MLSSFHSLHPFSNSFLIGMIQISITFTDCCSRSLSTNVCEYVQIFADWGEIIAGQPKQLKLTFTWHLRFHIKLEREISISFIGWQQYTRDTKCQLTQWDRQYH